MIEERMKQMAPNMGAIEEYKRKVGSLVTDICTHTGKNSEMVDKLDSWY